MSVVDFDTDSEGDATFGKYLQSDSLKKEERPVQAACPQPCEQQPDLDEEGGRVQGGVQDVSGEESDVLSEEVEILAGEKSRKFLLLWKNPTMEQKMRKFVWE